MSAPLLLFDTNVLSYLLKGHTLAQSYRTTFQTSDPHASFQTMAELRLWGTRSKWGPSKIRRLDMFLERLTIIHSDEAIIRRWVEIQQVRRKQPIETADAWIAATALAYDIPLVSHDPHDFRHIPGLRLLSDPFSRRG